MSPPNVLVFLTDDHGHWGGNCFGTPLIETPNLDFLAATGTRFENAFTPCPVCSPARASFFTGKMPSAHGIHDWLREPGQYTEHPALQGQRTLGMDAQNGGYRTGLCGKWHCGHFWEPPAGWDTWFSNAEGTNARFGKQPFYEGNVRVECHGNQADFITDRAVRFLREDERTNPFFLFVGYTNTHTPHTGEPERLVRKYRRDCLDAVPQEPLTQAHGFGRFTWATVPEEDRREMLAQYMAAITLIDVQVGRLLDELDAQGRLDETVVMYMSDHGHMNGQHGLHTKGNATLPQNLLEESIRIPLVARGPGMAREQVTSAMVDHCDTHATLREIMRLAEGDPTEASQRPGQSYLSLLRGTDYAPKSYQICEYGNARMIRDERWKLIRRFPGPNGHFPDELYDLTSDPAEEQNILTGADSDGEAAVARLDAEMTGFFSRYEVPRRTGKEIADLPACNHVSMWDHPPEHFTGIDHQHPQNKPR